MRLLITSARCCRFCEVYLEQLGSITRASILRCNSCRIEFIIWIRKGDCPFFSVPPQLLGIVPVNAGGFGSIQDAAEVFHNNEIRPIMAALEGVRHDG